MKDNYFFENVLEETCMYCKRHQGHGLYSCYFDYREECPIQSQLERLERTCDNLLRECDILSKQTKAFEPDYSYGGLYHNGV